MNFFDNEFNFLWVGGVFFYKLTSNPNLTKKVLKSFFFFFFFFRGGGGGVKEREGKCMCMNKCFKCQF